MKRRATSETKTEKSTKIQVRESHRARAHERNPPGTSGMSEWHNRWQQRFVNHWGKLLEQTESEEQKEGELVIAAPVSACIREGSTGSRAADILIPSRNLAIEIQHSYIPAYIVYNRNKSDAEHDLHTVWVVCGDGVSVGSNLNDPPSYELDMNRAPQWITNSFRSTDQYYLNIDNFVYLIDTNNVRVRYTTSYYRYTIAEFISLNCLNDRSLVQHAMCEITLAQGSAGTGKTHKLIQRMREQEDIDTMLFLAPQHSVKDVINNELQYQYENGFLDEFKIMDHDEHCRKWVCTLTVGSRKKKIIIATIASWVWCMTDSGSRMGGVSTDVFRQHVLDLTNEANSIRMTSSGHITYTNAHPRMYPHTEIVIDEGSLIPTEYAPALLRVQKDTGCKLFIMCDRLQHTRCPRSAVTYFDTHRPGVTVNRIFNPNINRRINNRQLGVFMNATVPYDAYDLPNVDLTRFDGNDIDETTVTIFPGEQIYPNSDADGYQPRSGSHHGPSQNSHRPV